MYYSNWIYCKLAQVYILVDTLMSLSLSEFLLKTIDFLIVLFERVQYVPVL